MCVIATSVYSQGLTYFGKETGEYGIMLGQLENRMLNYQEKWIDTLGGKPRHVFVPWIRDHVHVMKAMKYIHPDMKSFIEFYLENQTAEGLYFDYYFPLGWGGAGSRKKIFDQRYWKEFPADSIEMHRLPVEADLEYLLVEGVYAVWQSTGDTSFLRKWLPALVKGMKYSMSDPLRWSQKYQLVKRGYTLDTWDFMQLPYSRDEYRRRGGDVQKGIFDIDSTTPMGIMHGDNSGMYAACQQLAAMFDAVQDHAASRHWLRHAAGFRDRTNALCWNGRFYAHFVEDDRQPPYLVMDQANTLSLSNPYDINRGLPTGTMAQSIINTYRELKNSNEKNSFAEWYGVYPAVQPHFADYKPGSYMNGGVNTIVAGELAKAALRNGFEEYGIDILQRLVTLMKKHNRDLPVAYTPEG
jgi:glycogen debranching enzyme